jgi:hypothetical protein
MGYTTIFKGKINIDPPLSDSLDASLENLYDEQWSGKDVYPGKPPHRSYCQWVVVEDGAAIEWDQGEKFYDSEQWMRYLIEQFLKPAGHVCNGTILAQGEEVGDVWKLHVKDNVVSVEDIGL